MKVFIPVEVTDRIIEDFLITTFESGLSDSWLDYKVRCAFSRKADNTRDYTDTLKGAGIDVFDAETGEAFYKCGAYRITDDGWTDPDQIKMRKQRTIFDYVDIEWGLQIVARKEPQLIHQLVEESYDADDCDRIMQYILFGEQIFG